MDTLHDLQNDGVESADSLSQGVSAPKGVAAAEFAAPEIHENKKIFTFILVLAVIAVLCLFVMMYYLARVNSTTSNAQTVEVTSTSGTASTGSSESDSDEVDYDESAIEVVKVTEVLHENGAVDADGNVINGATSSSSSASGSDSTSSSSSESDDAQSTVSTADSRPILNVDEDVATANLQADAIKPYSVYVLDKATLNGTGSRPANGLVLNATYFTLRGTNEKCGFLEVATTASYKNPVKVPNVTGANVKKAVAQLRASGLGVRYLYESDSPSPMESVVFQAPAAGTPMPRGNSVIIVLAK